MVTVLKNVTNVITAVGEMYLFKKQHEGRVWAALFLMVCLRAWDMKLVSSGFCHLHLLKHCFRCQYAAYISCQRSSPRGKYFICLIIAKMFLYYWMTLAGPYFLGNKNDVWIGIGVLGWLQDINLISFKSQIQYDIVVVRQSQLMVGILCRVLSCCQQCVTFLFWFILTLNIFY